MYVLLKNNKAPVGYIVDFNDTVKIMTDCINCGYALNWRNSNKMLFHITYSHVLTSITKHVWYQN